MLLLCLLLMAHLQSTFKRLLISEFFTSLKRGWLKSQQQEIGLVLHKTRRSLNGVMEHKGHLMVFIKGFA